MTSRKFSLPVQSAVTNIPFDFSFMVGNDKYPCPKIAAINHCRTVQTLLLCDSTCTELIVRTPDNGIFFKSFIDFLINGKEVIINKMNLRFFRELSVELQCDKLSEKIYAFNTQNAKLQMIFDSLIDSNPYQNKVDKYLQAYQHELKYIASKFSELIKNSKFEQSKLNKLPLGALEVILDSKNRSSITSPDLFSIVYKIVKQNENNEQYLSLFSQIAFEQIDSQDAKRFFDLIKGKEVSGALWLAMTKRLKCNVK